MTIINPAAELVTSPATDSLDALWVFSDLAEFVNLAPCDDDHRPLQHLFTLPCFVSDSTIADSVGGLATLTTHKAILGQLVREVQLAREGQKGIFKKERYYLLYLEGSDGSLVTVIVFWNNRYGRWQVNCYPFDQYGEWFYGFEVVGN